MGLDCVKWPLQ